MAPAKPTLMLWPTTPFRVAEVGLPRRLVALGAAPISALLFGDENSPCPIPVITERQIISKACVRADQKYLTQATASPTGSQPTRGRCGRRATAEGSNNGDGKRQRRQQQPVSCLVGA